MRKSSSLSRHGISFDVPPPPELGATLVAPSSPARKTRRPLSKTSLNPNRSLEKNYHFLMTDLGLSNGYFCVVEQDDTFKFLIDNLKRRPDSPIDYHGLCRKNMGEIPK